MRYRYNKGENFEILYVKKKKIMIFEKCRSRLVKVDLLFIFVDFVISYNEFNYFFFIVSFIIFGVIDLLVVNLIIKNIEV